MIALFFTFLILYTNIKSEKFTYYYILQFVVFSIPLIFISLSLIGKLNNLNIDLVTLSDQKCTDAVTSAGVSSFLTHLNYGKTYSYFFSFSTILASVSNILALFRIFYNTDIQL